jgi:hypothetical protein
VAVTDREGKHHAINRAEFEYFVRCICASSARLQLKSRLPHLICVKDETGGIMGSYEEYIWMARGHPYASAIYFMANLDKVVALLTGRLGKKSQTKLSR